MEDNPAAGFQMDGRDADRSLGVFPMRPISATTALIGGLCVS